MVLGLLCFVLWVLGFGFGLVCFGFGLLCLWSVGSINSVVICCILCRGNHLIAFLFASFDSVGF